MKEMERGSWSLPLSPIFRWESKHSEPVYKGKEYTHRISEEIHLHSRHATYPIYITPAYRCGVVLHCIPGYQCIIKCLKSLLSAPNSFLGGTGKQYAGVFAALGLKSQKVFHSNSESWSHNTLVQILVSWFTRCVIWRKTLSCLFLDVLIYKMG